MIVLVLICVSQIYMLTSYFKDKTFGPNVWYIIFHNTKFPIILFCNEKIF